MQESEKKIIQQKKVLNPEEYKKVTELRSKVANLQKERNKLLQTVSKKGLKQKPNF